MALWAIGDVQGCNEQFGELLTAINFSADRDQLWLVGDLVNRGPDSLGVLRRVRSLGAGASVVLGNHDLHLLAASCGKAKVRDDDTLGPVLAAPDAAALLDWLAGCELMHTEPALDTCMVHAGLAPQWDLPTASQCAREIEQALRDDREKFFSRLYGDEPDRWDPMLRGENRLRFMVNCFTRMRFVDADGRLMLKAKGSPKKMQGKSLIPWYEATLGPLARFARGIRALVDAGILQRRRGHGAGHRLRVGRRAHRPASRRSGGAARAGVLPGLVAAALHGSGQGPQDLAAYGVVTAGLLIRHAHDIAAHTAGRKLRQDLPRELIDQFAVGRPEVMQRITGEQEHLVACVDRGQIGAIARLHLGLRRHGGRELEGQARRAVIAALGADAQVAARAEFQQDRPQLLPEALARIPHGTARVAESYALCMPNRRLRSSVGRRCQRGRERAASEGD